MPRATRARTDACRRLSRTGCEEVDRRTVKGHHSPRASMPRRSTWVWAASGAATRRTSSINNGLPKSTSMNIPGLCAVPGSPARDGAVVEGQSNIPWIWIGAQAPTSVGQQRHAPRKYLELVDAPHATGWPGGLDRPQTPQLPWFEAEDLCRDGNRLEAEGGRKRIRQHLVLSPGVRGENLSCGPGGGNLFEGKYLLSRRDFPLDHAVDPVARTVARQICFLRFDAERRADRECRKARRIGVKIAKGRRVPGQNGVQNGDRGQQSGWRPEREGEGQGEGRQCRNQETGSDVQEPG